MALKHHVSDPNGCFCLLLLVLALPFTAAQTTPDPRTDPYANMRFSPAMAIIIVVLIAALFFMGFFSIYIRNCSNDANGASVRPVSGSQRTRRAAARGLDVSVIETFPTFVYSEVKALKIGKGALECAVCLCEFEDDERLRLIPKCDHVFHPECIDAWLGSHTTCPVCRANLVPQPGEPVPQVGEVQSHNEPDLEAQNDVAASEREDTNGSGETPLTQPPEPEVISINRMLNRNRTRGSRSNRPRKFPRSHSTGHSLSVVQPGEDTERFTLRLPVDVRKQIMTRELNRANSLVSLPRESSSRRGYRTGGGEGSSGGRNSRWIDRMDRSFKSDRWAFSMAPPFFTRAPSVRSTKVAANDDNENADGPDASSTQPSRPPV
ncbi:E3 ubiquitin-protein ligase ATL6-like [Mangifera indica]|uniref:E3 ubiquitin-protein ligase ATL6-like n=1 Tax=Mangifera indica TaxID=29780 RepID=UPI001CFBB43B|nr:E3 ubiquitin-protein ligase ATL6-like [Mangifera indica]